MSLSFDPRDFSARMQAGKDAAIERRNSAHEWHHTPKEREAIEAQYSAEWLQSQEAADREWEELNRAEIARFGSDLNGIVRDPEEDAAVYGWAGEELAPLPHVAGARRAPARKRGNTRQQKERSMTGKECEKLILRFWPSVYQAAPDLGMTYRQLRRIVTGESEVHPLLEKLLRAMAKGKIKPGDLA
jgi:hypothetical protein